MEFVASAGLIPTSARSLPRLKLAQPSTVSETLAALASAQAPTLLAGGTDLVAQFNDGLRPSELIDLSKVVELRQVQAEASLLRIGAGVTHGAGSANAVVIESAPGFAQAWARIANPRIRFTATIGGNLMARRVRYEGSLLLTAAKARLEFATPSGLVQLTPPDLWAGNALNRSLLTAIAIDTADLVSYCYERSMRPLMTLALGIRRTKAGLLLSCAVATEYLQPVLLELALTGSGPLARNAKAIARDVFEQLPATFADAVLTNAYARSGGAVLLARQLAEVAHG
jgi:aerobic carbon-monoxide dehydrogenase medium subunit